MAQDTIHHRKTASGEKTWKVDTNVLRATFPWVRQHQDALERDLREMQETFRHWILVLGSGAGVVACPRDQQYIVPRDGRFFCIECAARYVGELNSLWWAGVLPVQIAGARKVEEYVQRRIAAGTMRLPTYPLDSPTPSHLLMPVKIVYPANWPQGEPSVFYTQDFYEDIGKMGGYGHDSHVYQGLRLCLFAHWHPMSIRDLIKDRVVPHAFAQVKIANGERPTRWWN